MAVAVAKLGKFATVFDLDQVLCRAALGSVFFHHSDDVHAFKDMSKNDVLVIKPVCFASAHEKLTSVCIFAGIGH